MELKIFENLSNKEFVHKCILFILIIIEKFTYKNGEIIFEKTVVNINEAVLLYSPYELLSKNLFNEPFSIQLKKFMLINIFPLPLFRLLISKGIDDVWEELYE